MKKTMKTALNIMVIALVVAMLSVTFAACNSENSDESVGIGQGTAAAPSQNTNDSDTKKEENSEQSSQKNDKYSPAPDFTVLDSSGNPVKLSDYRGRPVVLNFWATWCDYCLYEMPDFNEAYHNYPDVMFMMVNYTDGFYETVESATNYVEGEGFDFEIFFDVWTNAISTYGVNSYPVTFFIDADGYLITYSPGMLNYSTLEQGIKMITEEN